VVKDAAGSVFANPPGLFRRYDGVELYANKQFRNRFSFMGSLVYSRLQGNAQNVHLGSRSGRDPNFSIFFPGKSKLLIDRPLSWKIAGTYPLPWGFNAGWYLRHESGNTWQAYIDVPGTPFGRVFGEPAGSRRLPSRNLMDLRFEKGFPVYSGQLRWTIDVFNLFNTAYVTGVDDQFESDTFGQPWGYNDPRKIQLGIRYTF